MPDEVKTEVKTEVAPVVEDKTVLTTETKEPAKAEVKDGKTDETKTDVTPVEYKDFVLPEGFKADEESLKSFKTIAAEQKLTQEQAQKLVDLQTSLEKKANQARVDQWMAVQKEWRTSSQEDKEFGGAGFTENVALAKKALNKFGSPALSEALEATGMGNHPEVIRLLVKVGKGIGEDKLNTEGGTPQGSKDPAKILYPNMN